MDLVRKQALMTKGNVVSLVFLAGSAFHLRRNSGQLVIRQIPVRASVRAHVSAAPPPHRSR